MVSHGQSTTWRSPSLSRLNTWPWSSLWNPSTRLALFFELRRYPPSDALLTPAISPITGRLMEGGGILFLPVQVQRTCPMMHSLVTSIFLYACESWTLTEELKKRIQAMEMRCYHKILCISYKDHVTNEEVRAKIQQAIGPQKDSWPP